jgi:small GTP-binding protein
MTTKKIDELPAGFSTRCRLRGHTGRVIWLAWSPSGETLASCASDKTIRLWNINNGQLIRSLEGHSGWIYNISWSPNGDMLASASADKTVRLWNVHTGEDYTLRGHSDVIFDLAWRSTEGLLASGSGAADKTIRLWSPETKKQLHAFEAHLGPVYALVWSPDGKILASGSYDGKISLWNIEENTKPLSAGSLDVAGNIIDLAWARNKGSGMLASASSNRTVDIWDAKNVEHIRTLEGHTDQVTSVSFSFDDGFIASKSWDGTVRLWRCDTWEPVVTLNEPSSKKWLTGLAFHPLAPILATLGEEETVISVWDLDFKTLYNVAPPSVTVHYTSAKIVVVGESNVGKSCLALRLAENRYEEQGTTHGMRFWTVSPENLISGPYVPPKEKRDVVLWDMGGQDEYRLVHQLFLHDTTLALILLDPTRGRTAFEEAEAWNKRLEKQLHGRKAVKLLVGTKLDKESTVIDQEGLSKLITKCGFAGYYETSAKNGRGIIELRAAMSNLLDWERLAKSSRPELFQRIHDEIERQRKTGNIVLLVSDLESYILKEDPDQFELGAVNTVVEQLAMQGSIASTQVSSGERALVLQVGEVERYAGALIIIARNNPRGVPALEERMITSPKMIFPGIKEEEKLPRIQERVVLECVVQLLLEHGICLKHEGLLIFPSLFQASQTERAETLPHSTSLYYDFSGAIDNIYASLVAWLAISEQFGRMKLWEDRAEFEEVGKGACGLRKVERGSGFAHLDVYFEEKTPETTRNLFMSFIDEHLRQHGVDIFEHVEITCSCGFRFAEDIIRNRLGEGNSDIGCPKCDRRTKISEGAQKAREKDPELKRRTWALRTKVEARTKEIVKEVINILEKPEFTEGTSAPIRILHLSDLHMTPDTDTVAMLQPLVADLQDSENGLGVKQLDYLVISGDLTNRADPNEFERARVLVSSLIDRFGLTAQRCVIVPGNHDLDWNESVYDWKGRRKEDTKGLKSGSFVDQPKVLGVRNEAQYLLRFKSFSENFYHPLIQQEYPLQPQDQCMSFLFPEAELQFMALNSCCEIDEYYPERSSIHPGGLARCLGLADEQVDKAVLKKKIPSKDRILRIAVWHHPITGNEKIKDDAFLENLRRSNFRLCLHGHIHEDRADIIGYLHEKSKIYVAGAGSFGAPVNARPESTPRLYNLIEVDPEHKRIRVNTRALRKKGGAWEGWAVWPGPTKDERRTYYEIKV